MSIVPSFLSNKLFRLPLLTYFVLFYIYLYYFCAYKDPFRTFGKKLLCLERIITSLVSLVRFLNIEVFVKLIFFLLQFSVVLFDLFLWRLFMKFTLTISKNDIFLEKYIVFCLVVLFYPHLFRMSVYSLILNRKFINFSTIRDEYISMCLCECVCVYIWCNSVVKSK